MTRPASGDREAAVVELSAAYADLSAGIMLCAERIRQAIARGFTAFDFMRGNEPYKYRFGATDQPLYQLLAHTACPVQGARL